MTKLFLSSNLHKRFGLCLRFPTNEETKKEWLVNMRRESWTPAKRTVICSDHFLECDLKREGQRVILKRGAVPKRFKSASNHLRLDHNDPLTPFLHDHTYCKKRSNQKDTTAKERDIFDERKDINGHEVTDNVVHVNIQEPLVDDRVEEGISIEYVLDYGVAVFDGVH